ncbi:MAG: glycosyltransferase involved in cell wall biosynthesis [Flavobacterium sp.]|jgi:glycosyltransferase involved in cell wall biosynthesis
MKIAILGTRGVPNYYGGFEQFAEFFSVYLVEKEHEVYCYNSHNHPFQEKTFHGVNILHQYDPEYKLGTFGQFIYDFNCILDARKRNFDIILQLGYTSNSIWFFLLPKKPIIITNMDGIEWKRSKYSKPVQQFLRFAERLAAISSDYLVSDSLGIQKFLKQRYNKESTYIAYGAHPFNEPNENILKEYQVEKEKFNMIMARFEPENNLDMVLEGVSLNTEDNTFILVVGNHNTTYGEYLKDKFKANKNIRFMGAIYNLEHLNNLRYFSKLYFHGHSVGGTNPSLLEAMASKALIVAHNNDFNKGVLKENAFYFSNAEDVKNVLNTVKKNDNLQFIQNNFESIVNDFNWDKINGQYLQLFEECMDRSNKRN